LFHSPKAIEIFGFHPAVVTLERDYGAASPESQKKYPVNPVNPVQ
jgi:hypothetical protein